PGDRLVNMARHCAVEPARFARAHARGACGKLLPRANRISAGTDMVVSRISRFRGAWVVGPQFGRGPGQSCLSPASAREVDPSLGCKHPPPAIDSGFFDEADNGFGRSRYSERGRAGCASVSAADSTWSAARKHELW